MKLPKGPRRELPRPCDWLKQCGDKLGSCCCQEDYCTCWEPPSRCPWSAWRPPLCPQGVAEGIQSEKLTYAQQWTKAPEHLPCTTAGLLSLLQERTGLMAKHVSTAASLGLAFLLQMAPHRPQCSCRLANHLCLLFYQHMNNFCISSSVNWGLSASAKSNLSCHWYS